MDDIDLVVTISADRWANTKRRLAFLEAALARVLSDQSQVREWFTAKELAAMKLPGLIYSAAGITRKSAHHKWHHKTVVREGRPVLAYHYVSLPNAAFEALIRRILDIPDIDNLIPELSTMATPPQNEPEPQWMLPLMRMIKTNTVNTWEDAYTTLLYELPKQAKLPTPFEVERAFERLRR